MRNKTVTFASVKYYENETFQNVATLEHMLQTNYLQQPLGNYGFVKKIFFWHLLMLRSCDSLSNFPSGIRGRQQLKS